MADSNRALIKFLKQRGKEQLEVMYQRHGVDPSSGVADLVAEIRKDGSNSFGTFLRDGEGCDYQEIVLDVAGLLKAEDADGDPLDEDYPLEVVERGIWEKFLKDLPAEHRANIRKARESKGRNKGAARSLWKTVQKVVLNRVMVQMVRKWALKRAGAAGAGSWIPVINIAIGIWTAADLLTSPAMRKVVPTVIQVCAMKFEEGLI